MVGRPEARTEPGGGPPQATLLEPSPWRRILSYWNGIRPAWPVMFIPALGAALVVNMGPGREAVYAAMGGLKFSFGEGQFWWSLVAMLVCGLALYATFLTATNQPFTFSRSIRRSTTLVLIACWLSASAVPIIFAAFFLLARGVSLEWLGNALLGKASSLQQIPEAFGLLWRGQDIRDTETIAAIGLIGCFVVLLLITLFLLRVHGLRLFGWWIARGWVRIRQSLASRYFVIAAKWRWIVHVPLYILIALAVLLYWWGDAATAVGPVAVFMVGISLVAIALTHINYYLARRELPPAGIILLVLLLSSALASQFLGRERFAVDTVAIADPPPPVVGLAAHAAEWRQAACESTAIFVIAEGGGIYAALYSAILLSALDEASDGRFYEQIYALSGVSGGSVGIAAYLAARAETRSAATAGEAPLPRDRRVMEILGRDHFSPLLASLLFSDMPGAFLSFVPGVFTEDRARSFEASLIRISPELGRPVTEVIARARSDSNRSPAVLLNTAVANEGIIEVVGNVRGDGGPVMAGRMDNVLDHLSDQTLTLATGAFLSARFPLVSPPGTLDGGGSKRFYVDGGYVDNSGAVSARKALAAFIAAPPGASCPEGQVPRIVVLQLHRRTLSSKARASARESESATALHELSAPLAGIMGARRTNGYVPLEALCEDVIEASGAPGGLSARERCALIRGRFNAPAEGGDESVRAFALTDRADGPIWISAALDIGTVIGERTYVPLAWLLGPSKPYLVEQAEENAADVMALLGPDRP